MRWLSGFLALIAALALAGCSDSKESGSAPATPLLYVIESPQGEVQGWLLGTIHALPDDVDWRTPAVERVIGEADTLLVEVASLDETARIAEIFAELGTTPGLGPLPPRVDPELRGEIEAMIARSSIPASQFESTEDWAAAIMLARVDSFGEPRNGVDRALISEFAGREIGGFESAAQQLGIFDQLPAQDQRDLLEGTVREWSETRENAGWLTRAWIAGDVEILEAATTQGIMADPELRAALLVDRNRRWMPLLLASLRGPAKPLVAVGTAHILGPDGLPALLEAEGYRVTLMPHYGARD